MQSGSENGFPEVDGESLGDPTLCTNLMYGMNMECCENFCQAVKATFTLPDPCCDA